MPPAFRRDFISHLGAAQAAVRGGHVSNARTSTLYNQWANFCAPLHVDHQLQTPGLPKIELLQVYGYRVRDGHYSTRCSVRADSVAAAWRAVAEVHLLEGLPDPRKPPGSSSKDLDKRLSRMLRHYSYQDPPSKREKAIPLGMVISIGASADGSPKASCTSDLIQIALFFCLRSCEYSKTSSHRRTTQFRYRDLQFHNAEGVIPGDAPDHVFLSATAVTLFLDTQKNCVRGESTSMEATGLKHGDSVKAAARRFLHLRTNNADPATPICCYFHDASGIPASINSQHITATLRLEASKIGFQKLGFYPHEIGSHSLRSGGAMTLHLAGISEHTIKIIGRWRSDAFLIYLQGQIASFTKGVAAAMAKVQWFKHTAPSPMPTA